MSHITYEQAENYFEGASSNLDAHVASCFYCRSEISAERALARTLAKLERVAPSREVAARLDRALILAQSAGAERRPHLNWTGLAAFSSTILLLVFGYQMVLALQYGGALDYLSLYASRPDLISTYPFETLGALVESLPLLEFVLTLGLLILAVALGQQYFGGWRSTPHRGAEK